MTPINACNNLESGLTMKILVTGANGYLGKGIVKQLLDDNIHVIATDFSDDLIDPRADIKCCDLFAINDPFSYFDRPDVILHLAWRDGFSHNSPQHIQDLPKHTVLLEKLIDSGIEQVAVMGSMHEVGFFEGSIHENTPCNPQSMYGICKNALRRIVELKAKDKAVFQWLRGYYIVGNTADGCSVFSKIVQAVRRGEKEFPFTMGLNQFDFLDYKTFCRFVADTVKQREITGVINICSGRPEKLADRVERFIHENKFDINLKYGAFPDRPYDSKAIWGDDFRIQMIERNIIRE